jgi:tetratricopeptide (TPR) repeat protein
MCRRGRRKFATAFLLLDPELRGSPEVEENMTDMTAACVIASGPRAKTPSQLLGIVLLAGAMGMGLAACGTTDTTDTIRINKEQGTEENISSLTTVISANPSDPEGYNTRGSAYGRAGQFSDALDDFNRALELNPRFYQAYANRALIYRNQGKAELALADYNTALKLSPRYDVALSAAATSIARPASSMPR